MSSLRFSEPEYEKLKKILSAHNWGMQTLLTKLKIVNEDLKEYQDKDVIDYIAHRIKTPPSIARKLHNLGHELTGDNAKAYLTDIAGIRIICPFAKDINYLVNLIHLMPDVAVLSEKDYVSRPKKSGYRSYHMILEVPVFFSGRSENIVVEVQIRTEAMNFWASLEHRVKYKYNKMIPRFMSDELAMIADQIDEIDKRMYNVHENLELLNDDEHVKIPVMRPPSGHN
ncbi:MAG: GTP pyrophosphokinase family protein [Defluviitaleaceae bacterium]|nr:GTP pyrophosphokinase family protein [Defluviitaleaceae bacterium]